MRTSAAKRTKLLSSRGARWRSVMPLLKGEVGSTAKCAIPSSCSYGPTVPKAHPSANAHREVNSQAMTAIGNPLVWICHTAQGRCVVRLGYPPSLMELMLNAGAHLLSEAGARHERTLEAVRCSPVLDAV